MSFSVHYRLAKEVIPLLAGHFHRTALAVRGLQFRIPGRVMLALIEVRHDLSITAIRLSEEAQVISRLADVLTTDDNMRPLGTSVVMISV